MKSKPCENTVPKGLPEIEKVKCDCVKLGVARELWRNIGNETRLRKKVCCPGPSSGPSGCAGGHCGHCALRGF